MNLLTTAQAAEILRTTPATVCALVRRKGLPSVRLGYRTILIPADKLEQWIAAQQQEVTNG